MANTEIELSEEELERSAGGWLFDELPQRELVYYRQMVTEWEKAERAQDWKKQKQMEDEIDFFYNSMDAKYGA